MNSMLFLLILIIVLLLAVLIFIFIGHARLKRRVRFYQSVIMDCPYVMSEFTYPDLTYRFVSSASDKVFGLKSAAYVGRTLREMVHPDDFVMAEEIIRRCENSGHFEGMLSRKRHASLGWCWVESSGFITTDDKGVKVLICFSHSVDDFVRVRSELQESERRYHLFLQNTFDVVWELDVETRKFTLLSPISYSRVGVDSRPTGFVDDKGSLLPDEELALSRTMINRRVKTLIESGKDCDEPEETNVRVRNADGSLVWCRMCSTMQRDSYGRFSMVGVTRPTNLSALGGTRWRECDVLFNAVLSFPNMRLFWLDSEKVFQGCNSAFALDVALSKPSDIEGKTEESIFKNAAAWGPYRAELLSVFESGRTISGKYVSVPGSNGDSQLALYDVTPIKSDDGELCGVLGSYIVVSRDIIDRDRELEKNK